MLPLGVNSAGGWADHNGGASSRLIFQVRFYDGVNDPRDNLILYSDDGVTFSEAAFPSSYVSNGYNIASGGGKLFVEDYASATYVVMRSLDGGVSWQARGIGMQGNLTYDINTGKLYTSLGTQIKVSADDGLTFSNFASALPNGASGSITHASVVSPDGSTLVIVARNSTTKIAYVFTAPLDSPSPAWTARWASSASSSSALSKLYYIPQLGKYFAIGALGFLSSTDGVSWGSLYNSTAASLLTLSNLCYGNGVLAGAWGVNVVITTNDFATHTTYQPFGASGIAIYSIIFAFGKFYALVYNNQSATRTAKIYSSTNAISWTQVHNIPIDNATLMTVASAASAVTG